MNHWESFYVVLGSAGAALIGIEFVVMTLVANMPERPPAAALEAFVSPTVVHFTAVLLVAAVMSAPWPSLTVQSAALAACGIGGGVYIVVVIFRMRHQSSYQTVWQDWVWYVLLPGLAYLALMAGALPMRTRTDPSLFTVATATLGLLLVAIHNAWDSVMHLIVNQLGEDDT